MKEKAIKIENVTKTYEIGIKKSDSFRHSFNKLFLNKTKKPVFNALENINLELDRGEVLGVIGKNGAGKSTLLKVLSKITKPSKGRIEINGRVASLLEVGTGFHPELTGRENIYLNGTVLGMTRKEVSSKLDEIIAFSGVEKFIDNPVKHYSSGMYVRLAFSVAAFLEPEILIIDEILAVGDAEFQKKCLGKMEDVAGQGKTVLFVSHNMSAVRNLCTKGLFLKNGKIDYYGELEVALKKYLTSEANQAIYEPKEIKSAEEVAFKKIWLTDCIGELRTDFTIEDEIILNFSFLIQKENHPFSVFVIFKDKYDSPVFSAEHHIDSPRLSIKLKSNFLTRGTYSIHAFIHIPKIKQIDVAKGVCGFTVTDISSNLSIHGNYDYGNVFGNYIWIKK